MIKASKSVYFIWLFTSVNIHKCVQGGLKGQPVKAEKSLGRNDPCPCGSGKKYKKCCMDA
nr:SEC-C metal-binding domain-containing protein [Jeotgalibacillus malaysiensis]